MDNCESEKHSRLEDGMRTDTCAIDSKSLWNVESVPSIPLTISNISQYSNDDSLVMYDMEREFGYGVLMGKEMICSVEWSFDENRVIVADWKNRRLEVYDNGELMKTQATQTVVDLDASGRRWEGNTINGNPLGYGVLYGEEGRMEYEGFMMDGVKTCFGIEYYTDIGKVKYGGCYHNNSRFGKGVLYGRDGLIDYQGLWKNNEPYSSQPNVRTVNNHTKSVTIPNNSFNKSNAFILHSCMHSLKQIVMKDGCFERARLFELDGLSELESVEIGRGSFHGDNESNGNETNPIEKNTCFQVTNCPKLKSLQIGNYSFSDYHSFELKSLPSLQSLAIGDYCFFHAPSFSLTGTTD